MWSKRGARKLRNIKAGYSSLNSVGIYLPYLACKLESRRSSDLSYAYSGSESFSLLMFSNSVDTKLSFICLRTALQLTGFCSRSCEWLVLANSRSSCFVLGLRTIWVGCSVCNCSDVPKILLSKFSLLHLFGVFGQDNYSNVLRSYLKLIAWYGILVVLKTASPIQYPDYLA